VLLVFAGNTSQRRDISRLRFPLICFRPHAIALALHNSHTDSQKIEKASDQLPLDVIDLGRNFVGSYHRLH